MTQNRTKLGSFELGAILVNLLVFKSFTSFPKQFFQISGSGGLAAAVFSGLVFLAFLFLLLLVVPKRGRMGLLEWSRTVMGRPGLIIVSVLVLAYLAFSGFYALRELTGILQVVSYPTTPSWFLAAFLGVTALIIALRGRRGVYRLHTILTPLVVAAVLWIVLSSLKYADYYHLFPLLGNGPESVFGHGLTTLFLYSDLLLLFLILPDCREEVSLRRTGLCAGAAAVALNVLVVLAFQLSTPAELAGNIALPMYPLTKVTYSGKLFQRLDAVYLIIAAVSGLLYLSLTLSLIGRTVKGMAVKPRKLSALLVCAALIFTLCGCYDSREVEESAYVIALGIDKGETGQYKYTFQFSNPLSTGANSGGGEADPENAGGGEENKSVNNVTLEAEDYYMALNTLNSSIGKTPSLAHIKLIAFSQELAREGILEHTKLLLNEREVRPNTWLCISDGTPEELMLGIKPSLEESTARYYELLLQERTAPYAPVVELREFVNRVSDQSVDAVLPVIGESELAGVCLFSGDRMMAALPGEEALLYKILTGRAKDAYMALGGDTYHLTSCGRPSLTVVPSDGRLKVNAELQLLVRPLSQGRIDRDAIIRELNEQLRAFLAATTSNNCDVLGVRQRIKTACLTQAEWERVNQPGMYTNTDFSFQIEIKEDKETKIFQNF